MSSEISASLLSGIQKYHEGRWYLNVALLMPDHLHLLASFPVEVSMGSVIRDFKRFTSKATGIKWQRDFFDHRLRNEESARQKAEYIIQNPVRAGLIGDAREWPYVLLPDGLNN